MIQTRNHNISFLYRVDSSIFVMPTTTVWLIVISAFSLAQMNPTGFPFFLFISMSSISVCFFLNKMLYPASWCLFISTFASNQSYAYRNNLARKYSYPSCHEPANFSFYFLHQKWWGHAGLFFYFPNCTTYPRDEILDTSYGTRPDLHNFCA